MFRKLFVGSGLAVVGSLVFSLTTLGYVTQLLSFYREKLPDSTTFANVDPECHALTQRV